MSEASSNHVPTKQGSMSNVGQQEFRSEHTGQDLWAPPIMSQLPTQLSKQSQVTKSFRVLIADDHEIVRCGIRTLLESHPGWTVCGEACNGREAVLKTEELKPDLVILDVAMPTLNGVDAAKQILKARPGTPILILTVYESEEMIRQVLEIGARGFLLKSDAARNLLLAVEALQRRATFFTARAAEMMLDSYLHRGVDPGTSAKDRLTIREREVVQLLAEGSSSKDVANILKLSVKTVETHRTNVMRKLDLHSVAGLVRYAVRNSIVQAA
jgi:DNA-binding NarL/FixJ family response regulator